MGIWRRRDVAQLVERRTGTPLRQVRFPGAARDFSSRVNLSMQTLFRCPYTPVSNRMHLHLCARERSRSPCQSSVDYGNIKTPSMHPMLGSATLLQLAFPGEGNPNFPREKCNWENTVVKSLRLRKPENDHTWRRELMRARLLIDHRQEKCGKRTRTLD